MACSVLDKVFSFARAADDITVKGEVTETSSIVLRVREENSSFTKVNSTSLSGASGGTIRNKIRQVCRKARGQYE